MITIFKNINYVDLYLLLNIFCLLDEDHLSNFNSLFDSHIIYIQVNILLRF